MVTGLEVSSRLMVLCKRMSGNFTAVTEVLETRPKIRAILELPGKNRVWENCLLLTLRLGLSQCLVLSLVHVVYIVKNDVDNCNLSSSAKKNWGNVEEFHRAWRMFNT